MKKLFYILLTVSLSCILFFTCTKGAIMEELIQAEKQMDAYPDSALIILKELEENSSCSQMSKKQYALWCLLLTQAQHKNYIEQTSDSLIRVAVDYFEKKNDKPHRMKAYYYNAVIYHDIGDSPHAQEYYLKALEAGKESSDHAMLGCIYANLGSMYNYQNLTEEAKAHQEKALEHFLITKDSVNAGMAWQNIGRVYSESGALGSAVVCYSKAIPFLSEQNRSSIYNEIADLYGRLEQYPEAFEYIDSDLVSLTDKNDSLTLYYNLGDLYRQVGQYDSVYYYLFPGLASSNSYTRAGVNLSLSYLEEKQGNYPMAFKYIEQHLQLQDSIGKADRSRDLKNIESLHNYSQVEKERNFYEREATKKTTLMYLSAISTFTFIVISLVLYLYSVRLKKENKEKNLRLGEMKSQIEKQLRIAEEGKKLNELKVGPLYQKFMSHKTKIDYTDRVAIIGEIEKVYPHFIYNLKMLYPGIKEDDLHVCCLKKIDIPVNRIADILNKTSQGISNQRSRLCEKLTGSKGTATDLDEFLHNL
jgi:tetratricopeptide (TPR) repeat protein